MSEYKEQKNTRNKKKAHEIIYTQFPDFCHQFFEARRDLAESSQLSYTYSLREFFEYLHYEEYFEGKEIIDYTAEDINSLTKKDIESYFSLKEITNKNKKNSSSKPNTLKRTKACLSSFWNYYIDNDIFHSKNPIKGIMLPLVEAKDPVELSKIECQKVFDTIRYGFGMSNKQLENHDKFVERDYAIMITFLHTGIRVEELVGIDLSDINWETHSLTVRRKGHKEQEVYFSDDVEKALVEYISSRKNKLCKSTSPNALYLNRFGERISERSVERMLEKYISIALPNKKGISPHKLRSTYATRLLNYCGNLDLVSQALGHSNISTTQIYARTNKSKRAEIRNFDSNRKRSNF